MVKEYPRSGPRSAPTPSVSLDSFPSTVSQASYPSATNRDFEKEVRRLRTIAGIKSDHLIQAVAVFSTPDLQCILFPEYTTTLDSIFRPQASQPALYSTVGDLGCQQLVRQMKGIAEALRSFHFLKNDHLLANDHLLHLDVCPRNVLVRLPSTNLSQARLVLCDFDRSVWFTTISDSHNKRLQKDNEKSREQRDPRAFAGSSRFLGIRSPSGAAIAPEVTTSGEDRNEKPTMGQAPYRPPYEHTDRYELTPGFWAKYDSWSFGVVLLEVLIFIIRGVEGIAQLDKCHEGGSQLALWAPRLGGEFGFSPAITVFLSSLLGKDLQGQDKLTSSMQDALHFVSKTILRFREHGPIRRRPDIEWILLNWDAHMRIGETQDSKASAWIEALAHQATIDRVGTREILPTKKVQDVPWIKTELLSLSDNQLQKQTRSDECMLGRVKYPTIHDKMNLQLVDHSYKMMLGDNSSNLLTVTSESAAPSEDGACNIY